MIQQKSVFKMVRTCQKWEKAVSFHPPPKKKNIHQPCGILQFWPGSFGHVDEEETGCSGNKTGSGDEIPIGPS